MLFENETSSDGTNIIMKDFNSIGDIRKSDGAAYILKLCGYLQSGITLV